MSGISTSIVVDDLRIKSVIMKLRSFGQNPAAAMKDIAAIGESTTLKRFDTQLDPDGQRWKTSLRAQISGGITLTKDGRLSNSITSRSSAKEAEWGTNVIYGRIHQLGGVIKATAGNLRFMLANGAFISTKSVTIPKRPYLGVNESDAQDMLDALEIRIEGIANAG